MKHLRYMGEFVSVKGVIWRVEILQEADTAFDVIGSLEFPADEPLVIEWVNKNKEEVICSSVATLKIISPGDRTYEDLYSIEVGRVRLDVYCNSSLYWSGCIDTEFYEEPYEMLNGYEVSLTFSDFGVLERLKYDLVEMITLSDIINYCINKCGINISGINNSLISTQLTSSSGLLALDSINVRSDNFYDEDGDALSLSDVIKGILQPLALKIVQRAGKLYIYDLNALYEKGTVEKIVWSGDSQIMGVDAVYNNAKITWSPYTQSGNVAIDNCWVEDEKVDATLTALNVLDGFPQGNSIYYSYHYSTEVADWIDATDCGFTIWTTKVGENSEIGDRVRYYKIVPQYDGVDSEGIAIMWPSVRGYKGEGANNYFGYTQVIHGETNLGGDLSDVGTTIFKSSPVWIPPVSSPDELVIRIGIELLMDVRFNPFEEAANLSDSIKQKDWYDLFNRDGNFLYLPVLIKYQPDNSNVTYVWSNKNVITRSVDKDPVIALNDTYGTWVVFNGNDNSPNEWGYLNYYDNTDRVEKSGLLGWKKNRPAINPHIKKMTTILTNSEEGQYISYPNYGGRGGKIWVEVKETGWIIGKSGINISENSQNNDLWRLISWVLIKMPEIEIMNATQFDKAISTEDIEYNAEINSAAKEVIEIETICGTSERGIPTARGAYFNALTGQQITKLYRAGRYTQAEELLIGTIYSQYGNRRTSLSGENELVNDDVVRVYIDENQKDKKFIQVSDIQDVIKDNRESVFIELRPDEYNKR